MLGFILTVGVFITLAYTIYDNIKEPSKPKENKDSKFICPVCGRVTKESIRDVHGHYFRGEWRYFCSSCWDSVIYN